MIVEAAPEKLEELTCWGKQPSPEGYMTERYHAKLWDSWDEAYASKIRGNLQNIIDLYFPDGRP